MGFLDPQPKPSARLIAMVAEVAKTTGVPMPEIGIMPDLRPFEPFDPLGASSGVAFKPIPPDYKVFEAYHVIDFAEGIENAMDERHLKAIIAHELGHIANGDSLLQARMGRAAERRADRFAAKFGYGPDLIEALRLRDQDPNARDPREPQWWSHPSFEQREKIIREAK